MITKTIKQSDITAECWSVQFLGSNYCQHCEFYNKNTCGGKDILKTGKNSKGIRIGREGTEPCE